MSCGHRRFLNQKTFERHRRCESDDEREHKKNYKDECRCHFECENRRLKMRLYDDCKGRGVHLDFKKCERK